MKEMKGRRHLLRNVCFLSVCVERELIQSGRIFEVIQLLRQQQRRNLRLKHTNHFNLKPIPSLLTSAYYRHEAIFSASIRFSWASRAEEVDRQLLRWLNKLLLVWVHMSQTSSQSDLANELPNRWTCVHVEWFCCIVIWTRTFDSVGGWSRHIRCLSAA